MAGIQPIFFEKNTFEKNSIKSQETVHEKDVYFDTKSLIMANKAKQSIFYFHV